MIDSLLTLTRAEAAWLVGALVLSVLADRAITIITGMQEAIFLVLSALIVVALVVTSVYTAGKWVWHRFRHEARV